MESQKKTYRALMLDLDGTTIPNRIDGLPSERVINAILEAKKKVHVSIATGRTLLQAAPIISVLKLSDPIVLLNGALIIDGVTRKPIYEQPMLKSDYKVVVEMLHAMRVNFSIDEHEKTFSYSPDYDPKSPLSVFVWDQTEAQANVLIREFSQIPTIALNKVVGWKEGTVGVNISHAFATKQHGILEVARILDLDTHEIIGIGDGPNDFPLLMACGFKVAMGNAIEDLKKVSDHVAPTVDEDGVADTIEKFIL